MKLAEYLSRKGISRVEFARRIKMSEGMVSLLCSNSTWLSKVAAQKIFDATEGQVTPTDFLPQTSEEVSE